jgi:hypothetical protein
MKRHARSPLWSCKDPGKTGVLDLGKGAPFRAGHTYQPDQSIKVT